MQVNIVSSNSKTEIVDSVQNIESSHPRLKSVPWYVWCYSLFTVTIVISSLWDISWHRTIGRDTLYIAPHLAAYLSAIFAQVCCGYLILGTTFRKSIWTRQESTRIWGFYGPLGAFLGVWSAATLVVLSYLDEWWHSTFGLDVKIISPAHLIVLIAILVFQLGALLLNVRFIHEAEENARKGFHIWFTIVCAAILMLIGIMQWEDTSRPAMRLSSFYFYVSIGNPAVLVGLAAALPYRWASTAVAGVYTVVSMLLVWILPLFPAQPKIGPVLQSITHFLPTDFPLLFLVPAFFLDLIRPFYKRLPIWKQAIIGAAVFVVTFGCAQWIFAGLLMSPRGRNWFFGEHYYPFRFSQPPAGWERMQILKQHINYWVAGATCILAVLSSWVGLSLKEWILKIRR